MKYFIAFALIASLCALSAHAEEQTCHAAMDNACQATNGLIGTENCNARYGGITHLKSYLDNYVQMQLHKSFEYLLMATHFNSYQMNRPGFQKLYQGLSDRSFDDTIALIKQATRRGGAVDFTKKHYKSAVNEVQLNEVQSLAHALDVEKELTVGAIHVHTSATHGNNNSGAEASNKYATHHDPEMAHYLQENFLSKQAASVRKLAGYASDLSKMLKDNDPSVSVYLFDEYLEKQ